MPALVAPASLRGLPAPGARVAGGGGALTFLYLRRLGAHPVGAYVGGLAFALGPYLVSHLGDTATVVAAPLLPLVLLAAEAHAQRAERGAGGGPRGRAGPPAPRRLARGAGAGLARSSWAASCSCTRRPRAGGPPPARERPRRGRGPAARRTPAPAHVRGLRRGRARRRRAMPGSPAGCSRRLPASCCTTCPTPRPPRSPWPPCPWPSPNGRCARSSLALVLCLALRFGRGPLSAPGALALVFDLTLALLAGLSLSAPSGRRGERRSAGAARLDPRGRPRERARPLGRGGHARPPAPGARGRGGRARPRLHPVLPRLAGARDELRAGAVPPAPDRRPPAAARGPRRLGGGAPPAASSLSAPRCTRPWTAPSAPMRGERMLTLARSWPRAAALDLGFGNLAAVLGRSSANGYDPLVPRRTREALRGMSAAGLLPGAFFRGSPLACSSAWASGCVQAPAAGLRVAGRRGGPRRGAGPAARGRAAAPLPVPRAFATELRLAPGWRTRCAVPQGETWPSARCAWPRAASSRFPCAPGSRPREWAIDRSDVRAARPPPRARGCLELSRAGPGLRRPPLPRPCFDLRGRYLVDGLRVSAGPGRRGRLYLHRAGVADGAAAATGLSLVAAYLSRRRPPARDRGRPQRARSTRVRGGSGLARVVDQVKGGARTGRGADRARATEGGFDPRREAILDARGGRARGLWVGPMPGARARRAEVMRARGPAPRAPGGGSGPARPDRELGSRAGRRGWTAHAAAVLRVDDAQIGRPDRPPAPHRVSLRYEPRGFRAGSRSAASPRPRVWPCPLAVSRARPRERRVDPFAEPHASVACFSVPRGERLSSVTDNKPGLSIFFPAYNDAGHHREPRLVAHMTAREITDDYEVIVVDDGSPDHTGALLDEMAAHFPWLKVVHHEKNRGYGGALRTGFETASQGPRLLHRRRRPVRPAGDEDAVSPPSPATWTS